MAIHKIGVTERGDAGLDLTWADKVSQVDGIITITKNPTQGLMDIICRPEFRDKTILHVTVTGHGGTILEPNVPTVDQVFRYTQGLVDLVFDKRRIVIRIDPIIPTQDGLCTALSVFKKFMRAGFSRYRVSVIDMYSHVAERFKQHGIPHPYNGSFSPLPSQLRWVDSMLKLAVDYYDQQHLSEPLRIESCAEPGLNVTIQSGCVSDYDLALLGLAEDTDQAGYQRKDCLCYSGKRELLTNKHPCPHNCLYCYWKR